LDLTKNKIKAIEIRMNKPFEETGQHKLLKTMPGIDFIQALLYYRISEIPGSLAVPSGSPVIVV
jgi:hypothetical protein